MMNMKRPISGSHSLPNPRARPDHIGHRENENTVRLQETFAKLKERLGIDFMLQHPPVRNKVESAVRKFVKVGSNSFDITAILIKPPLSRGKSANGIIDGRG